MCIAKLTQTAFFIYYYTQHDRSLPDRSFGKPSTEVTILKMPASLNFMTRPEPQLTLSWSSWSLNKNIS